MALILHARWQLSVSDLGIWHCVICWCVTSVVDCQCCEITVMVDRHNTPNYLLPWTVSCRVDLTQREVCPKLPHCSLPHLSLGCPEAWFDDSSTLIKTLILATSMLFWAPQPVWPWLISDTCCFAVVFSCRTVEFDCYCCYCCGDGMAQVNMGNEFIWMDFCWLYLNAFDQCSTGKIHVMCFFQRWVVKMPFVWLLSNVKMPFVWLLPSVNVPFVWLLLSVNVPFVWLSSSAKPFTWRCSERHCYRLCREANPVLRLFSDLPSLSDGTAHQFDESLRRMERGARIVAVVAEDTKLILQMPRGNLESIQPRSLMLAAVRRLLDKCVWQLSYWL